VRPRHSITDALTKEIERRTQEKWEQEFRQQEADLARRTGEIAQREKALESAQSRINEQVEERVRAREAELLTAARRSAEQHWRWKWLDLKKANEEQAAKLREAQREELKLRETKRQLEARQRELDLEVAEKVDNIRRENRREGPGGQHRGVSATIIGKRSSNGDAQAHD